MSTPSSNPAPDHDAGGPLTTEQVLIDEALAIDPAAKDRLPDDLLSAGARAPRRPRDAALGAAGHAADIDDCADSSARQRALYQALGNLDRAALCLSGGGIRSAAFGLGVIQALATHPRPHLERGLFEKDPSRTAPDKHKPENTIATPEGSLLADLQFVSTVSGGGYIGSWLSVWRWRASLEAVWANLVGRPCGPDVEPGPFAWLRAYSNYLAPKLGALSGDTWAGVAISLRNLLLNWLVILPAICVILLLVKIIATISIGIAVSPPSHRIATVFALVAAVLLVVALRFITRNRPTRRLDDVRARGRPTLGVDQDRFIRLGLVPAALAAGSLIQLAASNSGLAWIDHHSKWLVIGAAAIAGAIIYALGWIAACADCPDRKDFWPWTLSGLVYGALIGTGMYAYNLAPTDGSWLFNDLLLPVMFGVPWILLSQMIAEMIFVGLSSYEGNSDADREWLGRAAGWYLVTALSWFLVTFLIFAGSFALRDFANHLTTWIAPFGGISGIVTAVIGKSPWSLGPGSRAKDANPLPSNIILGIAAPLFAAALIVVLSAALDELLLHDSLVVLMRNPGRSIFSGCGCQLDVALLIGIAIAALIGWMASYRGKIGRPIGLALIGPVIVTAAIVLVSAALGKHFGPAAWEIVGPLWLGGVIAGVVTSLGVGGGSRRRRGGAANAGILTVAYVSASAVFILFVSAALDMLAPLLWLSLRHPGLDIFSAGWFAIFGPLLVGSVMAAALGWVASYTVNINRFSLHAVYRNRLVRAFLGASHLKRSPDAFTGFDPDDNPPMSVLWPQRPANNRPSSDEGWRPFHVINMALNVVSTKRLSWQERKAESFTVSPLHSGSACKAYRRTSEYGGEKGISLGTAMAISGAAASPNMGYHSSPAVTFLLALFNVRLGWWFGNPGEEGHDTYRLEGPTLALQPLIEETFGLTTDERPYVYLSDGGHFENLGIYEMVRRRCRHIIAIDAGADPDYAFEDLGNAVRKIAIDLGVTIRFHGLDKLKKRNPDGSDIGPGHPYHAIGEINYAAADGTGEHGTILYIKAGYHGVESAGVRAYATANPAFPHQSTIDQFFSESQFESYRALGFEIADGILNHVLKKLDEDGRHRPRAEIGLKDIFDHLRDATRRAAEEPPAGEPTAPQPA